MKKRLLLSVLLLTSFTTILSQTSITDANFSQDAQIGWIETLKILRNGNQIGAIGTDGNNKLQLFTGSTSTSNTSRLTIDASGNIGIGTSNPLEKLDIKGNLRLVNSGNQIYWDWANRTIEQYSSDGSSAMIRFRNSMGASNPDGGFDFATHDGASVLRINQGKVGIGTTDFSGTHKLRVEGSIGSREIIVESSGWSDFVFEPDYDLPTLEEVEAHIIENGHLKDIPSAKEVDTHGIALSKISSKLLQKIEELTLYSIQANKRINVLEEKLQAITSKTE